MTDSNKLEKAVRLIIDSKASKEELNEMLVKKSFGVRSSAIAEEPEEKSNKKKKSKQELKNETEIQVEV